MFGVLEFPFIFGGCKIYETSLTFGSFFGWLLLLLRRPSANAKHILAALPPISPHLDSDRLGEFTIRKREWKDENLPAGAPNQQIL